MSEDSDFEMEVVKGGESVVSDAVDKGESVVEEKRAETWKEEWKYVSLEDLCQIGGGSTPSKSNSNYWEGGEILWTTPKDFDGPWMDDTEEKITEEGAKAASSSVYPENTTLLVVRSGVLRHTLPVSKARKPTTVNQDLKALQPHPEKVHPEYFFQAVSGRSEDIRGSCKKTGTTVESIQTSLLKQYELPVPPLPEQRKIASVLYAVDQAIQKTEEIIEQAKRVKQGLLQELLETGLGDRPIKEIRLSAVDSRSPEHWDVTTIGEVSKKITDGAHLTPDRSSEGYLLLSARNVRNGYLDLSDVDYVPREEYERLIQKCNPEPGDVLISCSGTVGRVCLVPDDLKFAMVRSAALVKLGGRVIPEYMEQVLQGSGVQKQIKGYQTQSAQPNLFQGQISRIEIPLPPKKEQKRIGKILRRWDSEIRQNKNFKNELHRLKKGLMQDLLTGEVRTADKAIEVLEEVEAHG